MFEKLQQLKKLNDLRSQAMQMQKALAQEFVTQEKGSVRVVLSCDQKVHKVEIDGENQEKIVEVLNDALKESQKVAAKKMSENMGGLGGLLGGLGR